MTLPADMQTHAADVFLAPVGRVMTLFWESPMSLLAAMLAAGGVFFVYETTASWLSKRAAVG